MTVDVFALLSATWRFLTTLCAIHQAAAGFRSVTRLADRLDTLDAEIKRLAEVSECEKEATAKGR